MAPPERNPSGSSDSPSSDSDKIEKGSTDESPSRIGVEHEELAKESVHNIGSVPNGGLVSWLQVVGAFFIIQNTWGTLNSFGAYQTFYESGQLFHASDSNLGLIGAIQAFLAFVVGALTGPIYDRGHFRLLLGVGSFLVVFGQMMLSIADQYYQVFLSQGVCIGIGAGCLFVPGVSIISQYFTTKLGLAIGIAAAGSSIGGIIYPIMFQQLLPQLGFGWTVRVIAFTMLGTLLVPNIVMKVRTLPPKVRSLIDPTVFREWPFMLFVLGGVLSFMGLYIPFFFIEYYVVSQGITDESIGFYLLTIINASSIFGRILPNALGDKTGPINMIVPCVLITGIIVFTALSLENLGGSIAFCIFYGFFAGSFTSLPPAVFISLTKDRGLIGTRMGMGFTIIAIGAISGAPTAGAILRHSSFTQVWAFGAATTTAGGLVMTIGRFVQTKGKLWAKA